MTTCAACHKTDLHHEYIELTIGWRPVLHHPDGTRHRCLKPLQDTTPIAKLEVTRIAAKRPAPPAPPAKAGRWHTVQTTVQRHGGT